MWARGLKASLPVAVGGRSGMSSHGGRIEVGPALVASYLAYIYHSYPTS